MLGRHGRAGTDAAAIERFVEERGALRADERLKGEQKVFVDDAFGKADAVIFDELSAYCAQRSVGEELVTVLEEREQFGSGCDAAEVVAVGKVLDDAAVCLGVLVKRFRVEIEIVELLAFEAFGDMLEGVGYEQIVRIEQNDDASSRGVEGDVAGCALAAIFESAEETEALVVSGSGFGDRSAVVGGAIIDNDSLEIVERLRGKRAKAFGNIRLAVVKGDYDGEGGGGVHKTMSRCGLRICQYRLRFTQSVLKTATDIIR